MQCLHGKRKGKEGREGSWLWKKNGGEKNERGPAFLNIYEIGTEGFVGQ